MRGRARKGIELSYLVTDLLHPVYYLLGEISDGASKSLIGVRFVRTDVQEPRIADIGVTPYPTANSSMVYACVHSMSGARVENASFDISVEPNGPIAKLRQSIFRGETRKTYEGPIPSAIVALAMPLSHISDSFTVHARLLSNGSVVDDVTVSYSCKEIGTPCTSPLILSTLILALVLLLIITTVVVTRRVSRHRPMRDKKVL
jgi:hypothetical protein